MELTNDEKKACRYALIKLLEKGSCTIALGIGSENCVKIDIYKLVEKLNEVINDEV